VSVRLLEERRPALFLPHKFWYVHCVFALCAHFCAQAFSMHTCMGARGPVRWLSSIWIVSPGLVSPNAKTESLSPCRLRHAACRSGSLRLLVLTCPHLGRPWLACSASTHHPHLGLGRTCTLWSQVRERVLLTVVISAQGRPVPGGYGPGGAGGSGRSPLQQAQHVPQQVPQLQQGGMQVGGPAIDPMARVVTPFTAYPGEMWALGPGGDGWSCKPAEGQ